MSDIETPTREAVPNSIKKNIKELVGQVEANIAARFFKEARLVIQQIYEKADHYDYRLGRAQAMFQEGSLYEAEYQWHKAVDIYVRAIHLLESLPTNSSEQVIYHKIQLRLGVIYFFEQRYERSLEFLFAIIEDLSDQAELLEEEKLTLCNAHFSTALVYSQNKYESIAIQHLDKTIKLAIALNDDDILGRSYNALAMTKLQNGDIEAAKSYFNQSIVHKRNINDTRGLAAVYLNISRLYVQLEQYQMALGYIEKALEHKTPDIAYEKLLIGTIHQQASKIHYKLWDYDEALNELHQALQQFEAIQNLKALAETYQLYCDIFVAIKDFEQAYHYSIKLNAVNQKIIVQEKEKSLTELQIKYDAQEKNKEAELYKLKSEALERSNQSLEEFAHIVAHDLKSPLRSVMGYVSLLKRRYAKQLHVNATEYIDLTIDSVKQMERLINDLLAFAKIDHHGTLHFETIDLNAVVAIGIQNIQNHFHENVEILCSVLPSVIADELQLIQLFQNLIENGIKYNTSSHPKIVIEAIEKPHVLEISVTDNGIGIPEDKRAKVFEVFQRLHHKSDFKGTGIGLSICKKIVESHGGNIWIETPESGTGTTFKFTLLKQEL